MEVSIFLFDEKGRQQSREEFINQKLSVLKRQQSQCTQSFIFYICMIVSKSDNQCTVYVHCTDSCTVAYSLQKMMFAFQKLCALLEYNHPQQCGFVLAFYRCHEHYLICSSRKRNILKLSNLSSEVIKAHDNVNFSYFGSHRILKLFHEIKSQGL